MRRRAVADKKLRGRAIRVCGARRRNDAWLMAERLAKFRRYRALTRFAHTPEHFGFTAIRAGIRVAALNHKPRNNAVERRAVVEFYGDKAIEICRVQGSEVFEEFDSDRAEHFRARFYANNVLRAISVYLYRFGL